MASDPGPTTAKVLFEWRLIEDENGLHEEVTESSEWVAYHSQPPVLPWQRVLSRIQDALPPLVDKARRRVHPAAEQDVRRALDSLQGIYDDLYGPPAQTNP